jgi:DNA-binding response OmpR family regulator
MLPAARPAILLVDDDPTLLVPLARRLSREGYVISTASSGPEALDALERGWPSLVVIDLMMPGMDGTQLAQRIKRIVDLPIIVVSAVTTGDSKISALEDFAEDYLTKPFVAEELIARINRVLRRAGTGSPQMSLDDGAVVIDLVGRQVRTLNGTSPLTRTEVRLAQILIGAMGHTVPTDTLISRVWPESDGADASYLWVTIRRLRRKIEPDPDQPRYLLTERGVGYRLEARSVSNQYAR